MGTRGENPSRKGRFIRKVRENEGPMAEAIAYVTAKERN